MNEKPNIIISIMMGSIILYFWILTVFIIGVTVFIFQRIFA